MSKYTERRDKLPGRKQIYLTLMEREGASQMVLVRKNPPANAGDIRGVDSIPGSGSSPGGGHGNPLQYSCLENPMDRGAWWAAIQWVARSWTRLKRLGMQACTVREEALELVEPGFKSKSCPNLCSFCFYEWSSRFREQLWRWNDKYLKRCLTHSTSSANDGCCLGHLLLRLY